MRALYFFVFVISLGLLSPHISRSQTWDWAVSNNPDFPGVIESYPTATDPFGNVYSAGLMFLADSVTFGPFTIADTASLHKTVIVKADSSGNVAWVAYTQHSVSQPLALTTDAASSLYALCIYFDTMCSIGSATLTNTSGGMMFFVTKLSPAGNVIWAHNIATSGMTQGGGIGVDAECNVYVTGTFSDSAVTIGTTTLTNNDPSSITTDAFITKYDSAGNNLWATSFGGAGNDMGSVITVTPSGTFYVNGNFNSAVMSIGADWLTDSLFTVPGGVNYYPYFAKFLKNGNPVWAKTPHRHTGIMDMTADPTENLYVAGYIDSSVILGKDTLTIVGTQNALVTKYDGNGNLMWANTASAKTYTQAYSIDVDMCGNVWIGGSTDSSINFNGNIAPQPLVHNDEMFIAAYDRCGRYIPGTGTLVGSGGDDKLAIALDNRGHLFVGGDYTIIPLVFGADSLQATPPGPSEYFFVARYTYGAMPCSMAPCCYITPYANFTDTGVGHVNFTYTGMSSYDSLRWDFGDGTSSDSTNPGHTYTPGAYHACLTVYTSCGTDSLCKDINVPTGVSDVAYNTDISIYPNPATDEFAIISKIPFSSGARMELYDIGGKLITTSVLSGNRTVIPAKGLATGVYHCRITIDNGVVINKQVVIK